MRAGLHFVTVFVLYGKNLDLNVVSRRLHDFNLVAYEELVLLLYICAITVGALYGAEVNVFIDVCVGIVHLTVFVGLAKIKARGKMSVSALGYLFAVPLKVSLILFARLKEIVDGLPVSTRNGGNVQGGLHAAFNLVAVDTRIQELGDVVHHAKVLGIENKGSALILVYGKVYAGTLLFHYRIFLAARVSAGTAVGVATCHIA